VHVSKEGAEILWDFLIADKVLCVFTCVELSHKFLASLFDLGHCFWEAQIFLVAVFKSDWTEVLELFCFAFLVNFKFRLLKINALLSFKLGHPDEVRGVAWLAVNGLEASNMLSVMHHHSQKRHQGDPDTDGQGLILLREVTLR
jgi:hypothetical protein